MFDAGSWVSLHAGRHSWRWQPATTTSAHQRQRRGFARIRVAFWKASVFSMRQPGASTRRGVLQERRGTLAPRQRNEVSVIISKKMKPITSIKVALKFNGLPNNQIKYATNPKCNAMAKANAR